MTGCIIFCTSIIGLDVGVGLNIHVRIVLCSCIGQGAFNARPPINPFVPASSTQVQAGNLYMTGCTLTVNNGISLTATAGQAIFVGGEFRLSRCHAYLRLCEHRSCPFSWPIYRTI